MRSPMGTELATELLSKLQATRETLAGRDEKLSALESSVNKILLRIDRPGFGGSDRDDSACERKSAVAYLTEHHVLKAGPSPVSLHFSGQQIDQAVLAQKAFASYLRSGDF